MQSNYAIFQKQPNTVGSFLQQGIGGLFNPRVTTDINDAAAVLQSNFTDLNSLAPIILDNPTDVFGNIIAENLLTQPDVLPPPIYDFDYPEPAPIDPYVQPPIQFPPLGDEADTYPDSFGVSETVEDPFISPSPGGDATNELPPEFPEVADQFIPGIEEGPVVVSEPIGQPIDTGNNPFYAGATNVAQPPSMTPVAPSFSLDVGVGGYGTPTNTAGIDNRLDYFDNRAIGMGGFGGFDVPTPTTNRLDYFDNRAATTATPQTTTTPLPTVNSFAGFNGFGGFGGF